IIQDEQINNQHLDDATFLVTRNDIRVQLNFDTTVENARKRNKLLIYSCAEDTYCRHPLKGNMRKKFLSVSDTKENALSGILPLFIGMKVILTINICISDNMANGTSGIIKQIIYHENSIHFIDQDKKNHDSQKPP
ncbi:9194_t:CDS:1, partial [Cetraspora pellucida]